MNRPYFNFKGDELIQLYEKNSSNVNILKKLKDELSYRKTTKMRKLAQSVDLALSHSQVKMLDFEQIDLFDELKIDMNSDIDDIDLIDLEDFNTTNKSDTKNTNNNVDNKKEYNIPQFRNIGNLLDVPKKRIFSFDEDIVYDIDKTWPLSKQYRIALDGLIKEIKENKNINQYIKVEDGINIEIFGEEYVYQFTIDADVEAFEEAKIIAIIGQERVSGKIINISEGKITISISSYYGKFIHSCIIKIDNTAILEVLMNRMEEIEKGTFNNFNTKLAEDSINNNGQEVKEIDNVELHNIRLNVKQKEAILKGLTNEILYLWGPPGTGKTTVISELLFQLFCSGKRTLIVSNTNQAVDQVLYKLCNELTSDNEAISGGKVLRVGKITLNELESEWGNYITEKCIIENKTKQIMSEIIDLNNDLNEIKIEISVMNSIALLFKECDRVESEFNKAKEKYQKTFDICEVATKNIEDQNKKLDSLERELSIRTQSNALRKLFMRKEEYIKNDIQVLTITIAENKIGLTKLKKVLNDCMKELENLESKYTDLLEKLSNYDRSSVENQLRVDIAQKKDLEFQIKENEKEIEDIKTQVVQQAQIVGATVTKTFLSAKLFTGFDTVIIDEASMVMLPAVFFACGMAKEKVFISGDYMQLPPIVQSNNKRILEIIGSDILTNIIRIGKEPDKRVVMLQEQYRMAQQICDLVSINYKNGLKTVLNSYNDKPVSLLGEEILNHIIVIDTSELFPYSNRNQFKSKYNVINALLGRNICKLFNDCEISVGYCTPYAAQTKLVIKAFESQEINKVQSGTIHRYQGDEKDLMVVDIPDSYSEKNVGVFLEGDLVNLKSNSQIDQGTKLFNVALSRARNYLVFIANLKYLDKKLPAFAYLRYVLNIAVSSGKVIDGRGIVSLSPEITFYANKGSNFNISEDVLKHGIFDENDFYTVCMDDFINAKKSIVVYSGFITPYRVGTFEAVFRKKIREGVRIRCVVPPARYNGSIPIEDGSLALDSLEYFGCNVDTRKDIHQKAVIIDDEIMWVGSLNPLSHNHKKNEIMFRFIGSEPAKQLLNFLSIDNRTDFSKDSEASTRKENPSCPECSSRVTYMIGQYGPYWQCENCGWKISYHKWVSGNYVKS
ncbi:AAA domain-containing protein [Sedimentibacter sp. B4]|uniref:AAA domain-containing protein n=1 Tax=Sedimentibacter sp. B4 TaxID=304766 RepID=UPI0002F78E07|nr:AAA domain-containing protein [Sedimentibacter sp. B4]